MLVGCNDGGKTALMSQILSQRPNTVHINFQSRAVTGVSSFVQLLADGFNVRYLKLRSILSNVLPFAGGEIFVMKVGARETPHREFASPTSIGMKQDETRCIRFLFVWICASLSALESSYVRTHFC